jgi:catalase
VLNRNPENYFSEIEQSTFEPSNMVPGIGPSPDKMLLGRLFSYHDTHLHRVGSNAQQLPVNRPRSPVHSYNRDGSMRYENPPDPVYAPNSYGGPRAQPERFGADPSWSVSGEIVRAASERHAQDDDFGQAGSLYRDVLDDASRERLVATIVTHVRAGVVEPVLSRVKEYWRQVDPGLGARIAKELEA